MDLQLCVLVSVYYDLVTWLPMLQIRQQSYLLLMWCLMIGLEVTGLLPIMVNMLKKILMTESSDIKRLVFQFLQEQQLMVLK